MSAEAIGGIIGFTGMGFLMAAAILFIFGVFTGKRQISWKRVLIGGIIIMILSALGHVVPK